MIPIPGVDGLDGRLRALTHHLLRGRRHRDRLADVDVRIAVTGSRGKSTLVRWLHETLREREYDSYAKVTGDRPLSLYDGEVHPIERDGQTMLYENEREIRRYDPEDAIVIENHGLREYTTRLVNQQYVDPTVVVLTNVRRDHLDTFGTNRRTLARALSRSIPPDAHVVSGERNDAVHEYVERELSSRGATVTRAVPSIETDRVPSPAEELIALLDGVLDAIDEPLLSTARRNEYVDRLGVEWTRLEEGRVYFAAGANDVDSTELIRRHLLSDPEDPVVGLAYFRRDRPGRTATYVEYLDQLADRDLLEAVHVVGAQRAACRRRVSAPVVEHDETADDPATVLDDALEEGPPVLVMGNAVPTFMRELRDEIDRRESSEAPETTPSITETVEE